MIYRTASGNDTKESQIKATTGALAVTQRARDNIVNISRQRWRCRNAA
jgi:hypothetical protein